MPAKQLVEVEGKEFILSNPAKVLFPESGFTKGEVLSYYTQVADFILPHLKDRPLTLKRYPDGVAGTPFYEKNAPSHRPDWVETFAVPRSEGGADINYILCNDLPALLWVTNLGDIEKHTFLAQTADLNGPTSIVFDLDPGEPAGILDCCRVAVRLKEMLAGWGLQTFVKVSGSKGLHLSVPLNSPVSYEETQPFAKAVAELATRQWPDEVVSDMAKALRKGKVLIDWSQNSDFKTTVAVYAMRAKENGPFISMPVTWEEVAKAVKQKTAKSLYFTPRQAIARLKKLGDLFEPCLSLVQQLPQAFTAALQSSPPPKLSTWQRHTGKGKDSSLREYAAKRDHSRTPEPAASVKKNPEKNRPPRFVIQKHEASHLHYDWRLEMEGVLRSWAVPKGPPYALRETRLAMHVEDHPLAYATFEGTIPPGNYGAGMVMVWDEGTYEDITGNPAAAFHAGKMHVVMKGKKLKGEWILVRDKRDDEGRRWLLIKAGKEMKPLTVKQDDASAVSRRSMKRIAKDNDAQWQSKPPEEKQKKQSGRGTSATPPEEPKYVEAMQCLSVAELPEDGAWNFEMKFDGYRCLAVKSGDDVTLFSRTHKSLNDRFPAIVAAFAVMEGSFAVDGEIVALDDTGKPSFQLLQNSVSSFLPVVFFAFDLLHTDGEDWRSRPFEERRAQLEALWERAEDPLKLSPLLPGQPNAILEAVRQMGLEGVVGKRSGSLYEGGERSGVWIKLKTNQNQEFVIGGYVPGSRGFDMLLIGVYDGKKLNYVAKLKDGFVSRTRTQVFQILKPLVTETCPFANLPEAKGASRWGESLTAANMEKCVWLKPRLVCQVAFVQWTDGGKLRHPAFVAMRDDKRASAVTREE